MNDRTQPNAAVAPPKTVIKPDPKETAQEAVHQVMPKSAVPKDLIQTPAAPLAAAKGNDEVMSQPPNPPTPEPADARRKRANAPTRGGATPTVAASTIPNDPQSRGRGILSEVTMNEQTDQNPANNPSRSADQAQRPGPDTRLSGFGKTEPIVKPGSKSPDQSATPPGSPDADVKEPGAMPPPRADGNPDSMSRQQSQAMPSVDEVKGKWKQQVGAAKIAWGKLTEDELLKSEGHTQKLAGLVQECYAVTRDEADKQIKNFFDKNTH